MGFSWTTFAFEVVNFVVFAWLLHRLLYRPLERAIDARQRARTEAEERVQSLIEQARELEAEATQQREALQKERHQVLEQSRAEAQSQRAATLARARGEASDLRRREEERLALERRQAEVDIENSSLDVARSTIEKVLQSLPLPVVDAAMSRELLASIDPNDVSSDFGEAHVASARELSEQEREVLRRQLETKLGHPFQLAFDVEPSLLAGLRLRLGSRLYDASLAAQLDRVLARTRRQMALGEHPIPQANA